MKLAEKKMGKDEKMIELITPGTYGLISGGAHSSGTFINLLKSSIMLTAKI
jgi:hypothetical protein